MSKQNPTPQSLTNKKIDIILNELDIMKPDSLLINTDPGIDAIEIIEQIQYYNTLINGEIGMIVNLYLTTTRDF